MHRPPLGEESAVLQAALRSAHKLQPAGAADREDGLRWAFRQERRQRAVSFKRMLGSRSPGYCESRDDLLGDLAGLHACVLDLYVLIWIEEVSIGVEPVFGILLQEQGP